MSGPTSIEPSLTRSIVDQIDLLVAEAEQANRPLEVDPYRGRLFELFVMADAADLLGDDTRNENNLKELDSNSDNQADLSSDALCRALAARWQLTDAARESFTNQTRLPPEHLSRMRLLWSVMRMWMEWTYAWKRWPEFHREAKSA